MSKRVVIIGISILGGFVFLGGYFLKFKYLFAGINRCCGNGRLDWQEECDKTVSEADYLNSPYAKDLDGDGNIDSVDYNIMKNTCSDECSFACPPSDPHFVDINKGCYQPEGTNNPCQKGVWVCDLKTGKVKCLDVYSTKVSGYESYYIGEEIYDYCCIVAEYDKYGYTTSSDAWADVKTKLLNLVSPDTDLSSIRVKPATAETASHGPTEDYRCDEVCRKIGKICVGTAITDDVNYACLRVKCHSGSDCTASSNTVRSDCRELYPTYPWDGDYCTNPEKYYVGYTSCLCY